MLGRLLCLQEYTERVKASTLVHTGGNTSTAFVSHHTFMRPKVRCQQLHESAFNRVLYCFIVSGQPCKVGQGVWRQHMPSFQTFTANQVHACRHISGALHTFHVLPLMCTALQVPVSTMRSMNITHMESRTIGFTPGPYEPLDDPALIELNEVAARVSVCVVCIYCRGFTANF